jgi:glycosyltransferase involved in cell wall biosynthesis
MNTPLVSVTMPTFNRAGFLPRSIQSILDQTFTDFELIIIDDGSTDNTAEVVAQFKDPRIIYVKNDQNRGISYSANRGIEMARGKYIARADSDDICLPERLAKTVAYMEAHPEVGVVGGQVMMVAKGKRARMQVPTDPEECRATLLFHPCLAQPTILIRRSVLMEHNLRYDLAYRASGDYEMWTRMMWVTKFANVGEVLLEYIGHDDQISGKWSNISPEQRMAPKMRILNKLGIDSCEMAETLFLIGRIYRDIESQDLNDAARVMDLIIKQNDKTGCFEPEALRRVFQRKWALFCAHATRHGLSTFRSYWSAPLAPGQRFSKMTAKILVKSMIRRS